MERPIKVHNVKVLTMRQFEVMELLATTNFCRKEIGAKLNIAARTVQAHATSAYDALGIDSGTPTGMRDRCRIKLVLWWKKNEKFLTDWPTYVRWVYDSTKGPSR